MVTSRDVARIPLTDALACGPEPWDRLVGRSPSPSPFMRWAWHQAWIESAPPDEVRSAFALAVHGPGGSIEALIPLALQPLRFRRARAAALVWPIGDVGCPDHLDAPAGAGVALDAAIPLIEELPWDVMVLRHVAEDATGVARLCEALGRRGHAVRRTPVDSCPYLDLPADWDAYLASLSPVRRQTIRRKERALGKAHVVSVADYAPNSLDEGWCRLRSLHDRRWGNGGVLADPRLDQLLRRFTSELAGRGELWLTTLDVDGESVAAWYGFTWNDTVYFYQGGRDPQWESESVGLVLMAAMIRRAIERGYRRFDFLRGQEAYKLSWTSTWRQNYEVAVFRSSWRGALLRGLDGLGRARERRLLQKIRVAP